MIEINELLLRIPGLSRAEARSLGEEVAQRVADGLPAGVGNRHLNHLDLQLTLPAGASRRQLADAIATGILRQIDS